MHLIRVAVDAEIPVIFLENVAVAAKTVAPELRRVLSAAGYTRIRECLVTAKSVGAPHERRRWFLLASLPTGRLPRVCPPAGLAEGLPGWSVDAHPPFVASGVRGHMTCLRLLGNAVVPRAARAAFAELAQDDVSLRAPRAAGALVLATPVASARIPNEGVTRLLRRAVREGHVDLATARAMNTGRCLCLRQGKLLVDTALHAPAACPVPPLGFTSPAFTEWLMGYAIGWTDAAAELVDAVKLPGAQNRAAAPRARATGPRAAPARKCARLAAELV